MENIEISQRAELQLQILQLQAERSSREEAINQSFKDLTHLLFIPASKKKESNSESLDENNALLNLSKMALNMSTDYIMEQKFGKKRPFSDFLTSMFVELISTPYINQKIIEIFAGIGDEDFDESEDDN